MMVDGVQTVGLVVAADIEGTEGKGSSTKSSLSSGSIATSILSLDQSGISTLELSGFHSRIISACSLAKEGKWGNDTRAVPMGRVAASSLMFLKGS